jgi:hypothetical protein
MSQSKFKQPDKVSANEKFAFETEPWSLPAFWLGLGVLFLVLDYVTGPYIVFPVFFIIPVLLVAWHRGVRWAAAWAFVLSACRVCFPYRWQENWGLWDEVINGVMQFGVLLLLASLTTRTARQTREQRLRIAVLEGILPICSFCKSIRDKNGRWVQLETYVSRHSAAEFSHGFCPKCGEEHYGDLLRDQRPV